MSDEELKEFEAARQALWLAIVRGLRLVQIVKWIDRQLGRWPWLYRRLEA